MKKWVLLSALLASYAIASPPPKSPPLGWFNPDGTQVSQATLQQISDDCMLDSTAAGIANANNETFDKAYNDWMTAMACFNRHKLKRKPIANL